MNETNVELGGVNKSDFHILLVEDNPPSRKMAVSWLRKQGYQVDEAFDGVDALEKINNQPTIQTYDLIVTDIMMPRMDGLELSEKIRAKSPIVPIILLTALDNRETVKQALRIGVNDFIGKPVDLKLFQRCVERFVMESAERKKKKEDIRTVEAVRKMQKIMLNQASDEGPFFLQAIPLGDAGGDVFRYYQFDDDTYLFVLVDVAGHSVESSYAVASFLGNISAVLSTDPNLITLLRKLNTGVMTGPFSNIHVCALLGRWSPKNGTLHMINAGLPYPVLDSPRENQTKIIHLSGTPLGFLPEPFCDEITLTLKSGDRILLGSDGFFDAVSIDRIPFENEVVDRFSLTRDLSIPDGLKKLAQEAIAWSGGNLVDDLLIIGFKQP